MSMLRNMPFAGDYSISLHFGERPDLFRQVRFQGEPLRGHPGLNFDLPVHTPVLAVQHGIVLAVINEPDSYGHGVVVGHRWGQSLYAHLAGVDVEEGQQVGAGQQVGLSGDSGLCSEPHLHFGLRIVPYRLDDGWAGFTDPRPYLKRLTQPRGAVIGPHIIAGVRPHLDILSRWKPRLITLLDPSPDDLLALRDVCPDSTVVARTYVPDQEIDQRIRENPIAAAQWANELTQEHMAYGVDYWQFANEVHQSIDSLAMLNAFELARMELAEEAGYRCAILGFSVGNPDLPEHDRMLAWREVYPALEHAEANRHIVALHQYGMPDLWGPNNAYDWYIYRLEHQVLPRLPFRRLKFAVTEYGIDGLIRGEQPAGWQTFTTPEGYVEQLLKCGRYVERFSGQVLGYSIFTLGHYSPWQTYDIAGKTGAYLSDLSEKGTWKEVDAQVYDIAPRETDTATDPGPNAIEGMPEELIDHEPEEPGDDETEPPTGGDEPPPGESEPPTGEVGDQDGDSEQDTDSDQDQESEQDGNVPTDEPTTIAPPIEEKPSDETEGKEPESPDAEEPSAQEPDQKQPAGETPSEEEPSGEPDGETESGESGDHGEHEERHEPLVEHRFALSFAAYNMAIKPITHRPDEPLAPGNAAAGDDVVYLIKDIFMTYNGSWEPTDEYESVPEWARDDYLRPEFLEAGADHHLFAAVIGLDGEFIKGHDVIYWSDGFDQLGDPSYDGYTREQTKESSGWANLFMAGGSSFVPDRGETGPWCWMPGGAAEVVVGGGLPVGHPVSTFVVWQAVPRAEWEATLKDEPETQPEPEPVEPPPDAGEGEEEEPAPDIEVQRRISEWIPHYNVSIMPLSLHPAHAEAKVVYVVKDIFTTRNGSWEPTELPGSIPEWARDAYLRALDAPDYFDDAGGDHHLFAAVLNTRGQLIRSQPILYWSDGFEQLENPDYAGYVRRLTKERSGWANIVTGPGSSFVPERDESGPWCWAPAGAAEVVCGGGLPANNHVSFFVVWQAVPVPTSSGEDGDDDSDDYNTYLPSLPSDLLGPKESAQPVTEIDAAGILDIRRSVWSRLGIEYHSNSQLAAYARRNNLGMPVTQEFELNDYIIQGFQGGVVYAPKHHPQDAGHIGW